MSPTTVDIWRFSARAFLVLFAVSVTALCLSSAVASENECSQTAKMEIYSNAWVHDETGDLLGYELGIDRHKDSTVEVLLYDYEGAPTEGIPLPGSISGNKLTVRGDWNKHLIEHPSGKEILQTHFVKIDGTVDSVWFRGSITIQDMFRPDRVRLKRVP